MAGRIARGEIRLYQFAAPDKKRPAFVLTRNSAIRYLSTVTIAPVTPTIRGVPSEVVLNEEDGMKSPCAVNLHTEVTVSQQQVGKRVGQLSAARMNGFLGQRTRVKKTNPVEGSVRASSPSHLLLAECARKSCGVTPYPARA